MKKDNIHVPICFYTMVRKSWWLIECIDLVFFILVGMTLDHSGDRRL